jgi:hypothetical protein
LWRLRVSIDTQNLHKSSRAILQTMRAHLVPPLFIAGFLAIASLLFVGCGGGGSQVSQSDRDRAVDEAQVAFRQFQATGQSLDLGPCVSEGLPGLPDWAVDVSHDPRQAVDDEPANQCQSYRASRTHHFVELTTGGQLIRAQ